MFEIKRMFISVGVIKKRAIQLRITLVANFANLKKKCVDSEHAKTGKCCRTPLFHVRYMHHIIFVRLNNSAKT